MKKIMYNSAGKPQEDKLHFVYLDIDVKSVEDLKEYEDICGGFDEEHGVPKNDNLFVGIGIPLSCYEDVCKAIRKITSKAYKDGLYYGANPNRVRRLEE